MYPGYTHPVSIYCDVMRPGTVLPNSRVYCYMLRQAMAMYRQITIVSSVWAVVTTAMKMPVPSPAGMQSMYCANVLINYMQQGVCREQWYCQ